MFYCLMYSLVSCSITLTVNRNPENVLRQRRAQCMCNDKLCVCSPSKDDHKNRDRLGKSHLGF